MSNIVINQMPYDYFGMYGPQTAYQPEWEGSGYKHYVFDDSPVTHVLAPDGQMHRFLRIHPEEQHLPVEHELVEYVDDTGYNPAEVSLPDYVGGWYQRTEMFGLPDSRPLQVAPQLSIRDYLPALHPQEIGLPREYGTRPQMPGYEDY